MYHPLHFFPKGGLTKIRTYGLIASMRGGGTVQRRIREEAASAGAAGGENSPAGSTAIYDFPRMAITDTSIRLPCSIPLTFIPLTFLPSFPSSPLLKGGRLITVNLSYFESVLVNLTSRPWGRGGPPTQFRQKSLKILFMAGLPSIILHFAFCILHLRIPPLHSAAN
jgi:hypothetical protein